MSSEETPVEGDPQISFKVKSSDATHSISISEAATVLDIKNMLSAEDQAGIPAARMRLIYSGRVMKDDQSVKSCNIKPGNTVHLVKNAQSNEAQKPPAATSSTGTPSAASGVPTNMAAGTANNPLAGLTGARYAGHLNLPGVDMFGADGGMGAPPNDDQMAAMLDDPNVQQSLNEALQNPAMVDMMINSIPGLRDNPQAREMFNSPEFRRMMTNPEALRQAAAMRRMLQGQAGGANAFPAPGVTDTTPSGAAGSTPNANPSGAGTQAFNPFGAGMGGLGGFGAPSGPPGNPFAQLFGQGAGQTPVQTPPAPGSAGQATPRSPSVNDANANPFASLFGGAGAQGQGAGPFGMTPEQMQSAMQMINNGGMANMFGGGANPFGGPTSPPAPADTRPPEERYADQLRQLNDMGFFDFDRNVEALRRSGGSVQGAIEQLLS